MSPVTPPSDVAALDTLVGQWREYVDGRRVIATTDADELEEHLRDRVADLEGDGLDTEEAFLIAVRRMGRLDEVTREFAREHSERLWQQLVLSTPDADAAAVGSRRHIGVMLLLATLGAVAYELVRLALGVDHEATLLRTAVPIALAPLAAYLTWSRRLRGPVLGWVVGAFVIAVAAPLLLVPESNDTLALLVAIHIFIALWLTIGVAYTGDEWRSHDRRMDFIRFTGEWFVYYVLIALGGGVLTAFVLLTSEVLGFDAEAVVGDWILPTGAIGAIVVAAWLVEAKQSVIENIAPVLARLFTPLFTLFLLAFVVLTTIAQRSTAIDRDLLIVFNLLLVVVLGMFLFTLSARDPRSAPGWSDRIDLLLIVAALAVDILVLVPLLQRIGEYGFTANRTAALGENVILLVNLAVSAILLVAFLRRRSARIRLERWQTGYLVVYAVWAWFVVLLFPVVFRGA